MKLRDCLCIYSLNVHVCILCVCVWRVCHIIVCLCSEKFGYLCVYIFVCHTCLCVYKIMLKPLQ